MRKRIVDYDQVVNFCKIPRVVKELMTKFNLTGSQVNKVMSNLITEKRILMEKVASDGALRNVYIDTNHSKYHEFKVKVYNFESLPAHDPFGLCKGARNAR